MSEREKKFLKVSNPQVPKLYTLPKIHKPEDKVRPIVSSVSSPVYNIYKWLVRRFKIFDKFETLSVKNSKDAIERTKDFKIQEDEVLISF